MGLLSRSFRAAFVQSVTVRSGIMAGRLALSQAAPAMSRPASGSTMMLLVGTTL